MKKYFKGFVKGLQVMILMALSYGVIVTLFDKSKTNALFGILYWLVGFALVYYLVRKYKRSKLWLFGAILGTLILPFLFGRIEATKE